MGFSLKESTSITVWIHRAGDIFIPLLTIYLLATFYKELWSDRYLLLGIFTGLLFVSVNQMVGVYRLWRGRSLLAGLKLVLLAWLITWLSVIVCMFLLKYSFMYSRVVVTIWGMATPLVLASYRILLRYFIGYLRARGFETNRIAIIGAGNLGKRLCKTMQNARMLGYIPVAFYDDDTDLINREIHGIPVVGSVEGFIQRGNYSDLYDEVYIALPLRSEARIKQVLNALADSTVAVKFIPNFFSFDLLHSRMSDIGGLPIISVYDSPLNSLTNRLIKRVEDIVLSILILLLVSPVMLVTAVGVKLSSPGPIIYKQKRIGWNGRPFKIYKFRSMPVDTEVNGINWGASKEKTNSRFGAFIRKSSIDELPQFINTLKGDMSIVGPRPERDVFVEKFRKEIPRYMQKHMVKAGITGWAQVHGWRGDTSLKKRVEFDLFYIDNWSLWMDIKIILLTIIRGIVNKNAY